MADEQELGFLAHGAHQLGVAFGVGIVQRRIHLVQQTERRGVELEDRKHQGNGRQRLFAAREQVDRLVFLAGRLGQHLHTGVEDFLAGHDQTCVAAAKQFGEHLAEMGVDGFERARQQIARFHVNFFDCVFQRHHGLVEVSGLRIQELLALTGRAQLVQCREVDGTQ